MGGMCHTLLVRQTPSNSQQNILSYGEKEYTFYSVQTAQITNNNRKIPINIYTESFLYILFELVDDVRSAAAATVGCC